jgi:hypothetical protein
MSKTTIQIEAGTRDRLKGLGTMDDTYDTVLEKLIESYEEARKRAFFVETQHEIAKKGKFTELD